MPAVTGNANLPHEARTLSVEQFHKTKMCPHMNKPEGCIRSVRSECPYAHSPDELKDPPNLIKTAMCKLHLKNSCNNSKEDCPYAHDFGELRHTEGFYKTFVCKFWQKGHCKAGDLCRYAHGTEELRKNPYMEQDETAKEPTLFKNGAEAKEKQNIEVNPKVSTVEKECNTPTMASGYCFNHGTHSSMYLYPLYGDINPYCLTPRVADTQQWFAVPDHLLSKEQEEAYYLMQYYLQKYIDCSSKQQLLTRQHSYLKPPCTQEGCHKN